MPTEGLRSLYRCYFRTRRILNLLGLLRSPIHVSGMHGTKDVTHGIDGIYVIRGIRAWKVKDSRTSGILASIIFAVSSAAYMISVVALTGLKERHWNRPSMQGETDSTMF